jgi:hypothetical protein
MKAEQYFNLKAAIIEAGYAHEINWIANIQPCDNEFDFSDEATWVILNSGMKEQIARQIWNRIQEAWSNKKPTSSAFGHQGKVKAIDYIRKNKQEIFEQYVDCLDQLEFLESLPFIGKITKYHLAKNLGMDVVKPDRHLVRIAKQYNFDDCFKMCQYLRSETGDKLSLIDMVIWRAANLGWV